MELAGIAIGVIGLLPICADGCTFLVSLCRADRSVQEEMIRIRAQRAVRCPASNKAVVSLIYLTLARC